MKLNPPCEKLTVMACGLLFLLFQIQGEFPAGDRDSGWTCQIIQIQRSSLMGEGNRETEVELTGALHPSDVWKVPDTTEGMGQIKIPNTEQTVSKTENSWVGSTDQ